MRKLRSSETIENSPVSAVAPYLITVLGPKGGVGKTLVARSLICRFTAAGIHPRVVQIDRTPALRAIYGDEVIALGLPGTEKQRADPLAVMKGLEPFADAIDASLADGRPLVTDVGGGPTASAVVEFVGKGRLDAHVAGRARAVVMLTMVSDSATMIQTIGLGAAIEQALPHAAIVPILNERDGSFDFFPGSSSDRTMRELVNPFLERHPALRIPAVPAGALAPFEAHNLSFTGLIEADPGELSRRLGISRVMAAVLQGDVAEWLSHVWESFHPIVPLSDEHGS